MNKITKITTIAVLGTLPFVANATTGVRDLGNGLYVPDYSKTELWAAGCDPEVWEKMVDQYVKARGIKKATEEKSREQIQLETPKNDWESCFSGALSKIDSLRKWANSKWSIFSGEFDMVEAGEAVFEKYLEAGCRQVDKMTSGVVGGVTSGIKNTVDGKINEGIGKIDEVTGVDGLGKEIMKTNEKNEETLFSNEKLTMGDIIGKDNMPTTSMKEVSQQYMGLFGSSAQQAGQAGSSLLDALTK